MFWFRAALAVTAAEHRAQSRETAGGSAALETGELGYFGIDVHEEEENLFFRDLSEQIVQDDVFMRPLTFPNVLVAAHQTFFTHEPLANIAQTTSDTDGVRARAGGAASSASAVSS